MRAALARQLVFVHVTCTGNMILHNARMPTMGTSLGGGDRGRVAKVRTVMYFRRCCERELPKCTSRTIHCSEQLKGGGAAKV